jgi:hypothetical protein
MRSTPADEIRSVYLAALDEAIRARHRMLGTGHLLLGLVRLETTRGTSLIGLDDGPLFDVKDGRGELVKLFGKGCWLSRHVRRSRHVDELEGWRTGLERAGVRTAPAHLLQGVIEQEANSAIWLLTVLGRDVRRLRVQAREFLRDGS